MAKRYDSMANYITCLFPASISLVKMRLNKIVYNIDKTQAIINTLINNSNVTSD